MYFFCFGFTCSIALVSCLLEGSVISGFFTEKKNDKLCQVIFNVEPKKNDKLCLPNHTLRTLYSALQQSYISVQLVYLVEQIYSLGILKLIVSKMNHSWKCLWAESVLCFFLINNKSFFFYIRDANFRQTKKL